jgi:hypothetical protein
MLVALTDGQQIEYHASFNFPRHILINMTPEGTKTLKRERQSTHHKTCSSQTAIQELCSQVQELGGTLGSQNSPPTDSISV